MVVKGRQATRSEAPILVIAPHSTFFDGGIIYVTGFPSIIVRRESGANPYIGSRFLFFTFYFFQFIFTMIHLKNVLVTVIDLKSF